MKSHEQNYLKQKSYRRILSLLWYIFFQDTRKSVLKKYIPQKRQLYAVKSTFGISLLEITLSTGILLIVALLSYGFVIQLSKGQNYILEHTSSTYQAQNAINTMIKELREAALSDSGAYPIEQATNVSVTFYSDVDTDSAREKITYTLVGTTLNRTSIEPTGQPAKYKQSDAKTQTLTANVINAGPIFTYFNGSYPIDMTNNPLTAPIDVSQIRLIHVRLEINPRPNVAPQSTLIESDVQLRNLKDNLAE